MTNAKIGKKNELLKCFFTLSQPTGYESPAFRQTLGIRSKPSVGSRSCIDTAVVEIKKTQTTTQHKNIKKTHKHKSTNKLVVFSTIEWHPPGWSRNINSKANMWVPNRLARRPTTSGIWSGSSVHYKCVRLFGSVSPAFHDAWTRPLHGSLTDSTLAAYPQRSYTLQFRQMSSTRLERRK